MVSTTENPSRINRVQGLVKAGIGVMPAFFVGEPSKNACINDWCVDKSLGVTFGTAVYY
jgi:hypothetical protein